MCVYQYYSQAFMQLLDYIYLFALICMSLYHILIIYTNIYIYIYI